MSVALHRPQAMPLERVRPEVALLVVLLHLGLLWVANLYWPLQHVLLGAMQNSAPSITVQIVQKSVDRLVSIASDNAGLNINPDANPQAISNPGRQRFGRSEAMLALPTAQPETSTPLAGTVQAAQATPQLELKSKPNPTPAISPVISPAVTQAASAAVLPTKPVPQTVAAPERAQAPAVRMPDEKSPDLAPAQPMVAAQPLAAAPIAPAAAAAAAAAVPAPAAAPVVSPGVSASSAPNSSASDASNPGTGNASGGVQSSSSGNAVAPLLPPQRASEPLNLNLPPRTVYRPPIAVPRRSLSDIANDQLRRKPRDPFAESVEGAGNIDCLKDAPDGPAQGLLAIGPLLKRAIEEKCRK